MSAKGFRRQRLRYGNRNEIEKLNTSVNYLDPGWIGSYFKLRTTQDCWNPYLTSGFEDRNASKHDLYQDKVIQPRVWPAQG